MVSNVRLDSAAESRRDGEHPDLSSLPLSRLVARPAGRDAAAATAKEMAGRPAGGDNVNDEEIITKFKLSGTVESVRHQVDFIRRTLAKWASPEGRAQADKARAEIKAGKYRVL